MPKEDRMTETIRIRIEPEKKKALTALFKAHGTTLSQATREFFDKELESVQDPLARFDKIMNSADSIREAYSGPEPTIDDIVAYIDRIRDARSHDSVA